MSGKFIISHDGTMKSSNKENRFIVDKGFYEATIKKVHKRANSKGALNSYGETLEYMAIDFQIRKDINQKFGNIWISTLIPIDMEDEKAIKKFVMLFDNALGGSGSKDLDEGFNEIADELVGINIVIGVTKSKDGKRNFVNIFKESYKKESCDTSFNQEYDEIYSEGKLLLDEERENANENIEKNDEDDGSLINKDVQKVDKDDEHLINTDIQKLDEPSINEFEEEEEFDVTDFITIN